jgi:mannose-6-phosphate isomerase
MDSPLRFKPYLRPMVWGGRRLETVLHKPLPTEEAYGESWEVSDHALHRSIVESGPATGSSLRDLMERQREGLLGRAAPRYAVFPWLVKFLDASDWLSVQVHPDEEAVRRFWPGEGSKTEAWFVLDAAPGSRIYAGLRPGIDEQRLRTAIAAGTVAECLHSFEPRPGDCVFLPAGTVHAVGGGVLIAEVQQTSDATFRLFDWNRRDSQGKPRQLHVEEGLASIHWEQGPVEPVRVVGFDAPRSAAARRNGGRRWCRAATLT